MFRNGYCKHCFFNYFNLGIFHPYKCTSHLNIEKINLKKEKKLELQDHYIYISFTGNIKVGITLKKNLIKRLMDQGATKAIIIAKTPNRYLSGIIENICKKKIPDRTNYIKMLTNNIYINKIYLINLKKKILKYILKISKKLKKFFYKKNKIYNFIYPIIKYPKKIKNFNLLKTKKIKDKLIGIKGQYLIFSNDTVLNINNHLGYSINLKIFK
ncbi:MAG: DUF2797 domain-containing protein [Candidatus Shikimatogenerans bostrichidophilus]|nr:MAG: DUF2797 domain-containing protein [Candidatus Shikimatogenerans bostrichidophilus]